MEDAEHDHRVYLMINGVRDDVRGACDDKLARIRNPARAAQPWLAAEPAYLLADGLVHAAGRAGVPFEQKRNELVYVGFGSFKPEDLHRQR